jgi:predicted RNA-binding Zn ribbon-like protein
MAQNEWDFDAGSLVLDFTNTAEFHDSENPDEMINSYADLVSWSEAAGILTHQEGKVLLRKAKNEPQNAEKVLEDALEFRELIYRIISALVSKEPLLQADLDEFNRILTGALMNVRITKDEESFTWGWGKIGDALDSLLWPLAREAANLLTSQDINRVGKCADDRGCGYLFIDTSRNHSRRWCSMEACGNRAKAQRYYKKVSRN